MLRIIPQFSNNELKEIPSWLHLKEITAAGKEEVEGSKELMKHVASIEQNLNKQIVRYSCSCGKIYTVDNVELKKQLSIAKKANKEVIYSCPNCKQPLHSYQEIIANNINRGNGKYANEFLTEKSLLDKEASGTINTFVDSHIAYKAIQALQRYAIKNGATAARVKYINSEHGTTAGQSYPTINNINCEIEWLYAGRKMNDPVLTKKGHVVATISFDQAGQFIMPKVLKTASGKEYPFEKSTFEMLQKNAEYERIETPIAVGLHGAIIQPTYKKPDVTNFRMGSMREKNSSLKLSSRFNQLKKKLNKRAYNIEALRENLISMLQKSSKYSLNDVSKSASDVESWISFHSENPKEKVAFLLKEPMLKIVSEINDGLYDEMLQRHAKDFLINPSYANAGIPQAPNPGQTSNPYQPNQQVLNPADGKTYTVQQDTPGQGITVVDPQTQIQSVIPENERGNIRPVLNTDPNKTVSSFSVQALADEIIKDHLKEDIKDYKNQIDKHINMLDSDIKEIVSNPNEVDEELNEINQHEELIKNNMDNIINDKELVENLVTSNLKKQSNQEIHEMSRGWQKIRKTLRTNTGDSKLYSSDITKESRQVRAVRELGFNPLKADPDKKGHDKKTNVPVGEKGEFIVGLTDFPKDQKRNDNVGYPGSPEGKGYGISMKNMDEKQVREREHFDNERRLPVENMRRDELKNYINDVQGGEKNYGLDPDADNVIQDEIGMKRSSIEKHAADEEVKEGPVQQKELKTAPKLEGFKEPAVIEEASGKVKEAITKFRNTSREIEEVKEKLKKAIEPINETLRQIREPFDKELNEKEALKKSYLDMIYEQLVKTESQVVAYEDSIVAAFSRVKITAPNITLAQVIKKADEIMVDVSEKIKELKKLLESEVGENQTLERFIYQYPLSKSHEKKTLKSSIKNQLQKNAEIEKLNKFVEWLRSFEGIDSLLTNAIAELQGA